MTALWVSVAFVGLLAVCVTVSCLLSACEQLEEWD